MIRHLDQKTAVFYLKLPVILIKITRYLKLLIASFFKARLRNTACRPIRLFYSGVISLGEGSCFQPSPKVS